MELSAEDMPCGNGRRQRLAVIASCADVLATPRLQIVAVNEIAAAVAGNAIEQRARLRDVEAVPAHMGQANRGILAWDDLDAARDIAKTGCFLKFRPGLGQ